MTGSVLPMYSLRTVEDPKTVFYYNSAMYEMKNLVSSTPQSVESVYQNSSEEMYSELEHSQAIIFENIAKIKKQIEDIRQTLLKRVDNQLNVTLESKVNSEMLFKDGKLCKNGVTHEVVISADVNRPPYSLLVLNHLTEHSLSFKVTSHYHSSLVDSKKKFEQFQNLNRKGTNIAPVLDIRLIWMNNRPTSVTLGYVPLDGEVSLLRFIHSFLKLNLNPTEETKLQELLDQLHNAGSNSFESVVKGTDYLISNRLTVLDIGLWSALKSTTPSDKLQKWFQHLDKLLSN